MMPTQGKTRFSVIIPVYNTREYLDEAVNSVLEQSFMNYEIILVDDGSTDGSGELCDAWLEKDSRIRSFHQENSGQIAAREHGIQNAHGEYVLFLDSDDYLISEALAILDDEINASHADCVIFGFQKVENGQYGTKYCDPEKMIIENPDEFIRKICCESSYNSMCRKAILRERTLGNDYSQYHFLRHGEDLIQSLLILMKCKKVVFINSVLYNYRMVSSSISHNRKATDYTETFAGRECAYKVLQKCSWLSNTTMIKFKEYSTKKFVEILLEILMQDISDLDKKTILHKIKVLPWNSEYIAKPLDVGKLSLREKIIMQLFEKGAISVLLNITKLKKLHNEWDYKSNN